jgi:hypothetical protein
MNRFLQIVFTIYLISGTENISAQEVLTGLEENAVAQKFYREYNPGKKSGPADTLSLPFIDDFSDSNVIPKPLLWTDKNAFVNNTYPIFPISAGVATLDALDFSGSFYPNASIFPFQADYLSSKPINLALIPADSVYLSFYYQPKGLGEMPETSDSLLLDFYSMTDNKWHRVWATPGDSSFRNFKRVMIRIADLSFLKKGFRFRFRNYASLFANTQYADKRSNTDHWNIDYIKLDKNRTKKDTILRDVTFIDPMLSLLKDYETVPWKHFEVAYSTQQRPYIKTVIINHDSIDRNIKTSLEIKNLLSGQIYKTTPTSNDLASGDSVHFLFTYDYPFNFNIGDSGIFEIKAVLGTDVFDFKPNDTLRYQQHFHDYYALDDGTSEAGYGLRGDGTKNASVAVRFNTYLKDSLRAVDVYFNHTFESLNLDYYLYLNVWADNSGKPGNILVNQVGMRPKYSDNLNKFVRYYLDRPVELSGTFYVGWQKTVDKLENIGFDLNRINNSKIFYTDNGVWKNSIFPGSLMIRPVLSQKKLISSEPELILNKGTLSVYPNPADKELFFSKLPNQSEKDFSVTLYDVSGRKIRTIIHGESSMYTGDIKEGIYIIRLTDLKNNAVSSAKIIISH